MSRLLWVLVPLLAAASSCQGEISTSRIDTSSTPDAGTTDNTPPDNTPTSSAAVPFKLDCSQSSLGSPVLRLLNSAQFVSTVNDLFPQIKGSWTSTLPANPVSARGFDNDSSTVVGPQLASALLDSATAVATAVTGTALATILPCSTGAADRACAEQFVMQYGRRLFRRTLTPSDHDRYLTFFDSALAQSDFKTALKWVTVGLIQSPYAVYRSEIGTVASDGSRQLSPVEVATELAYTYAGSTPTDDLLSQAEKGSLGDPVALATSLLAAHQDQALQDFFGAYLAYPRVGGIARDVPSFDAVKSDLIQETRDFINDVLVTKAGTLTDLLTSPITHPSAALAQYYGFPAPGADGTVTRPTGRGIGLLAQGSILASRAQPNGSSPTQRGLLVFSNFLCELKPSPPPTVPPISAPQPGKVTTRQRYAMEHAAPGTSCSGCHRLFDPIGFGFEHFNEGGIYRADESGLMIDTVSDVPNPDGTVLFPFQDQETLAQGLAAQPVVTQCFAAFLATYAFGSTESCLGASRVADLKSGALGVAAYFAALAAEPDFTRRLSQ